VFNLCGFPREVQRFFSAAPRAYLSAPGILVAWTPIPVMDAPNAPPLLTRRTPESRAPPLFDFSDRTLFEDFPRRLGKPKT